MGLHQRYATLLEGQPLHFIAGRKEEEEKIRTQLSELFDGMMQTLFRQQGAHLDIEVLETPKMQEFIEAHASVLDSSFEKVKMSDLMRRRLTRSNYIFSGMKTFHELNEAFPSLLDEDGSRKPFRRFLNDVRKIDEKYNGNYLRAEYNFVVSSAEMAARWEGFMGGRGPLPPPVQNRQRRQGAPRTRRDARDNASTFRLVLGGVLPTQRLELPMHGHTGTQVKAPCN